MSKQNNLVIVESPTKAKTIQKYLPKNFKVMACVGHVRDLPSSAASIPKKYKDEEWAKLGVNVENNFEPLYVAPKGKSKVIKELKDELKNSQVLYLATDEDREGESISWHLMEVLHPKVEVKRMVFHEITKSAIEHALQNCREVNMDLVRAQEARRILDRLYGYTLSPLIWKKIAYGLSAGRVQSSGLRLIVERERERMRFKKSFYNSLKAQLYPTKSGEQHTFEAHLTHVGEKRVVIGKDFDEITGELKKAEGMMHLLPSNVGPILQECEKSQQWVIEDVQEKEFFSNPPIPFITSTLQQEGNRKLGMTARVTMRVAQKLYEEGLITYMRTDSPQMSDEAIQGARQVVRKLFGAEYLSESPKNFKAKAKSAQEAHEAIRPAGVEFIHPDQSGLKGEELQLYQLIWKRTLATQMAPAKKSTMTLLIKNGQYRFSASGTKILFHGHLKLYTEEMGPQNGEAGADKEGKESEVILPALHKGDQLKKLQLRTHEHETRAPARFTEASLIQNLEKRGIGRPSTYASIISTIIERNYVSKKGHTLVPSFVGLAVIQLLENHFPYLVNYEFTSQMEDSLDSIACGELDSVTYLHGFYSGKTGLKQKVDETENQIDPNICRTIQLEHLHEGEVRVGRYGPYVVTSGKGQEEVHASIPEDVAPADLKAEDIADLIAQQKDGPTPLGVDPKSGMKIYCLVGRYGPYLQLGEKTEENEKPRRASLPKEFSPKTVDLATALQVLSLPRELGKHPDSKKPILTNNGRFGPYVECNGEYRSLKKDDNVYEITLQRALELLQEEKKGAGKSKKLKDFGLHPKRKKNLSLYSGKYGPYLKLGTKNISLPPELVQDIEKNAKKIDDLQLADLLKVVEAALAK